MIEIFYTFPNTHAVIAAEQALLSAKIAVKVRPVPNAIRAGCGLCLCVSPENVDKAEQTLAEKNIEFSEAYLVENNTFTLIKKK